MADRDFKISHVEIMEAADECGVLPRTIRDRLRRGWSEVEAMHVRKGTMYRDLRAAAKLHGLTLRAMEARIYDFGWSVEKTISTPRRGAGRPRKCAND
jgi:hypothetical protein